MPDDRPAETLGIPIPEKVTRWHPLIRQTRSVLRDCAQDEHGRFRPGAGCLDILVTKACRQRAYRVMDTILKECHARGWTVRVTESRWPKTIVTVEGGEIAICLEEMLHRGPEKFTDEERLKGRYGMQLYPRFPSGRFVLKTDWPSENARRAWREGKRFSLEYVLKQFIDDVELAAIWRREADERAAKAEERRREEDRARCAREDERRREEARVAALLAEAQAWAKSRVIRDYVAARVKDAKGVETGEGSEVGRWAAWALAHADRLDPVVNGTPVETRPARQSFYEVMESIGRRQYRGTA